MNQSAEPVTLLRPGGSALLEHVGDLPGLRTLPAPSYKLEAKNTASSQVYRGIYRPPATGREPEARGAKLGEAESGWLGDDKLVVGPKSGATQRIELPFALPKGRYSLSFTYEYHRSSTRVPSGWFTGSARAPAIELVVPQ